MRTKFVLFTIFGLFIIFPHITNALKCWQCISNDCEGDPEKNFKAEKISCKEGGSCLKVLYKMHDNKTDYKSIIRTCSAGQCNPTPYEEYQTCLAKDHGYLVLGCSLRLCCNDDLCNSSPSWSLNGLIFVTSCMVFMHELL